MRILLSAVILEAASYRAASIPFELFQNADDAVIELESLCIGNTQLERTRPADLRCRVKIEVAEHGAQRVFRLLHWGRGINQFRIGSAECPDEDFDRDMERMLVLQGSGKGDSTGLTGRTGKFGLGFKSVLFVCNEPRVLSGSRSRFSVVAGVYPRRLSDADEERLQGFLDAEGDTTHKGTVIELPLNGSTDVDDLLRRFRDLVRYIVIFARRIRECSVIETGQPSVVAGFRPHAVLDNIESGILGTSAGSTVHALVFRLSEDRYDALLLPIGPRGVAPDVTEGVPEIWVTTPTGHGGTGCLLVNGAFDLNPGRTQLRNETETNSHLPVRMGERLGECFHQLYDASTSDWLGLRKRIGCQEASHQSFWESVWSACLPYTTSGQENTVLRTILFGSEHSGMYRLAREADVIPTQLPDRFGCLTSLAKIEWRARGILLEEDVWASASLTDWCMNHVAPGGVVTHDVACHLDRFCAVDARELSLAVILHGMLNDTPYVEPDTATELGRIVNPKRLREMADSSVRAAETQDVRKNLKVARFRTAADGWATPDELLICHDPTGREEEHRRAAFAPTENLLAKDYVGDALEFFLVCRKRQQADAERLADWILDAQGEDRRKAALQYLECGKLSHEVGRRITEQGNRLEQSWLNDQVARTQAMKGMDLDCQAIIMGTLRKGIEYAKEHTPTPGPKVCAAPQPTRSAQAILRDILSWWRVDHQEIISYHDHSNYPLGRVPQLCFSASLDQLQSDVAIRKEWLILFMRGTMLRIGRARCEQHRGFLDLCDERGWLNTLAKPTDEPAALFEVMDDYLNSLQEKASYFHWMNQFLAYYQLARWLPNYARAFEAVTRPGVRISDISSISDIADLRTSHIFAGSTGFDAPPCSRTMGLGSHFVLREVIRVRRLQCGNEYEPPPELARLAFVPSRAVRRLVSQISQQSDLAVDNAVPREYLAIKIADILDDHLGPDATFDGCFDIPLLALTWKKFSDKRKAILGCDGDTGESPETSLSEPEESEEHDE